MPFFRVLQEIILSSNQRAIRLAIAGLMIIFGLISLSQAGYFVIRYLTLKEPMDAVTTTMFVVSAWRSYWLLFGAVLIQFTFKQVLAKPILLGWTIVSLIACLTSLVLWA